MKPLALCAALLAAVSLAANLAACGGGDGAPTPPPVDPVPPPVATHEVPASALESAASFGRYAGSLPASDDAEPLAVDQLAPPTSDADEPIELG